MLHITGLRDSYHEMQSVFTFHNALFNILEFDHSCEFNKHSAHIDGISQNNNLIHRARDFLVKIFGNIYIPDVKIIKNIPNGAGLGSGSSDTAVFLLHVLYLNNIPIKEIIDMAKQSHVLGMDIPVFLYKGINDTNFILLDGVGKFNELSDIKSVDSFKISIFPLTPHKILSTKLVFDKFKENPIFDEKLTFTQTFSLDFITQQKNSLQKAAIQLCPEIEDNLSYIRKTGADIARMSGSGSACFGVYQCNASHNQICQ